MDVENMHKRNRNRIVTACAAAAVFVITSAAQAALINPGGQLSPVPAEADPVTATQVANIVSGFSVPNFFTGTLETTVYNNDASNPFGLNALTFVFQLNNSVVSNNMLARVVTNDFAGFQTDVSYRAATGVIPASVDRFTPGDVGYSFNVTQPGASPLAPGQSSAWLVIQTNATIFGSGNASVIDGAQVNGVPILAPFIPEPGSLTALAAAGGLLLRRRR